MSSRQITSVIDGLAVSASLDQPNINPSDVGDVIAHAGHASAALVSDAVASAQQAQPGWAHTTPWQRADVLDRAGSEIATRADELGDLLAREEGKTLPEARGEVMRAAQILKYYAGVALQPHGQALDSVRPGIEIVVTREPVGVVAAITPWNFPIAVPAWKIAPALAFGNAVILKPAELVPSSAWELVDILNRAGLPPGVLNLVIGEGAQVGSALVGDPRVNAVSFTGSTATGQRVREAAVSNGARVQLELGGKNALVVTDRANLEVAVEAAMQGGFGSAGQRCTASSILVVTDGIHDAFVETMQQRMGAWQVGDARADGVHMGPIVDERQLAKDLHYLDVAQREGGVIIGGERLDRPTPGHYLSPALVLETAPDHTINQEEVFGPVMSVIRVPDYEAALVAANATSMNLSSGICTTDLAEAMHFRRHARAGMVMVNLPTAGVDFHVPFGGRGSSSYGPREQGTAAAEFYTVSKTAYLAGGLPD